MVRWIRQSVTTRAHLLIDWPQKARSLPMHVVDSGLAVPFMRLLELLGSTRPMIKEIYAGSRSDGEGPASAGG